MLSEKIVVPQKSPGFFERFTGLRHENSKTPEVLRGFGGGRGDQARSTQRGADPILAGAEEVHFAILGRLQTLKPQKPPGVL